MSRDRRRRRAAWAISGGLHLAAAAGLWLAVPRSAPAPAPADHEPDFALVLGPPPEPPPPSVEVVVPPSPPPTPAAEPEPPPAPPSGRPPTTIAVPSPLSREVAAFVRARAERPVVEPVRDVVTVTQVASADTPTEVTQAAAPAPSAAPVPPRPRAAPPVHGELRAGTAVVYVLDCSGTMGLGGRLDRARAAVLATLETQSSGVRVQVVTYSGRAAAVLPKLEPADDTTRGRVAAALARLEPAGASRHADAVRAALRFDPDFVVLFTDAAADELADALPVVRGARRPVSVSVARVTADAVGRPVPLR